MDSAKEEQRKKNKYSRQNAALGAETTKYLSTMKLLIVGMRGVGVEMGKNCLLQGVGSLTIYDPTAITMKDVGSNFFLAPEDVGKPRDVACRPRLAELNPDASVVIADAIDEELVSSMSCVVFAGLRSRDELVRWNNFCRSRSLSFVWAVACGLATSIFVDHGPEFTVRDVDGEKPSVRIVESIQGSLLRYAVPDGVPATSLNPNSDYAITDAQNNVVAVVPYRSDDGDPANTIRVEDPGVRLNGENGGGILTERKRPTTFTFESLSTCLLGGQDFLMTDYTFTEKEKQLHAALVGVLEFEAETGRSPTPNDEADADAVVTNAKHFAEACRIANRATGNPPNLALHLEGPLDEALVRAFARHAACEFRPYGPFCAGLAPQEL